jgi:hypothetical protein
LEISEGKKMRIAVIGSRTFDMSGRMTRVLDGLPAVTEIVTGDAAGANALAEEYAKRRGIPLRVFAADWRRWRKGAAERRNRLIIESADLAVAFWDHASPGTRMELAIAEELGREIRVVRF